MDEDLSFRFWKVTAEVNSIKINTFKENNFVAIGWDLGDLTGKDKSDIDLLCKQAYRDCSPNTISQFVSQINLFVNEISIGDYIISSDSSKKEYVIGKCVSDYYHSDKKDTSGIGDFLFKDCHDVNWLATIKWDEIPVENRKYLNLPKSVFEVKNDDVKVKLLELLKYKLIKRNIIYFGAPGTGKSYNLNRDIGNFNFERVTFHPDYSYANFVGTYKPVPENSTVTYRYVPGPFMRILKSALDNPDKPYVLVIEEINRANVAAVFGDVFQLLDRNSDNESAYPINASEDMKTYINKDQIKLPSNLFIWATMNSADQGVYPMDTAFKRRWDFKYFTINHDDDKIKDTYVMLNGVKVYWNRLRKLINDELLSYKINEDKLIGPFFAFNEYHNQEIPSDVFSDVFKNKIIMYLFEDAARSRRNDLFSGARQSNMNITYSRICEEFDENGLSIFCDNIINHFITDED